MTDGARKLLEDALTSSNDERLDLAEQLVSSLSADDRYENREGLASSDPKIGFLVEGSTAEP